MTLLRRARTAAVLLLGLAAAGAVGLRVAKGPDVRVVQPAVGPVVQTVVSSGRVLPPAEIKIGALLSSTVGKVLVEDGAPVEEGQLLVQLDDAEARAAMDKAKAALEQAQAGRYEVAKLDAPAANAALREANITYAQAKRRLAQEETLFQSGVTPRASYDDARSALELARTQRRAAQLRVRAAAKGGTRAMVAAAGEAQAKAQLALAKEQLRRTRIVSPVKGVVLDRDVEPGDAVLPGTRMLLLARTGATRLVIEPDERNLASLRMGQKATASAEAFPTERFEADLQYIAPSVDPQRGTVEVRLAVPKPPAYLRPHMTVSVEIEVGKKADVLLVPRRTVRGLASKSPYLLIAVDGRVARRPITVGIRGDERVEVSGVQATDWIVDEETSDVADGDRVRPIKGP